MEASATIQPEVIKSAQDLFERIRNEVSKVIVGQEYMVARTLLALLTNGHVLIEGIPGLAKTTTVHTLAQALDCQFQRIQFTPDLLPADLTGTEIYRPQTGSFEVKKGPVFANLLLADEINRAPSKVQSALLESMQEGQVTIGDTTFALPKPFLVLATQNPLEQEGTYPLPEAQIDRFMFKLQVGYPSREEEREIIRRVNRRDAPSANPVVSLADIDRLRSMLDSIYIDTKIEDYILDIVSATRPDAPNFISKLSPVISFGASPRAGINLMRAARGHALMEGRDYVAPQDVKTLAPDVLRHRILLTFEAEADSVTTDDLVRQILDHVDAP